MNIKTQDTKRLPNNPTFAVGIYKKKRQITSHNRKNYTGKRFGMLVALNFKELIGKERSLKSVWQFRCDCGQVTAKVIYDVVGGKTKSCGCLNRTRGKLAKNWKGCGDIPHTYFSSLKQGAKTRNLSFKVTLKYLWMLFNNQNKKCSLTGEELIFDTNCFKNTASLDRIDSKKGYTEDNVQWIHKVINFMKQNMSDDDFVKWCKKVTVHNA